MGMIEKIDNLDSFLEEHPEHSFLAHMAIFKPERESTKVRVVFLSNLKEMDRSKSFTVSHNQAMHPGPCLNSKMSTSLISLRFDKHIFCYDIKKAFQQIALGERDQNKLLFLWFKNVDKSNFEMVAYRNKRLSFGLRTSPAILMLAMFKILVLDAERDEKSVKDFKNLLYHLLYMDNGAFTTNNISELYDAYDRVNDIFLPYKFELQQFVSNNDDLQAKMDSDSSTSTSGEVKLFGLKWDREKDQLSCKKLYLNESASSKRQILQTVASNFDPFNFAGPILNRAKMFLHDLQNNKKLDWDKELSVGQLNEWKNIARQVNLSPVIQIDRFVGRRDESYRLVCFTDSSKQAFGSVVYIQNCTDSKAKFLLANNRLVSKQLEGKSIPSLEFNAISLGVSTLMDLYESLADSNLLVPVKITEMILYTDSLVCLNWLNSYINNFDKLQKVSIFVKNRLKIISDLCQKFPITFKFIAGCDNPADMISRAVSYKQLVRSNYFTGPESLFRGEDQCSDALEIIIPNPLISERCEFECKIGTVSTNSVIDDLISRYSDFDKVVSIYRCTLVFVNRLKERLKIGDAKRFEDLNVLPGNELYQKAITDIIRHDQFKYFPEVFAFFGKVSGIPRDMPNLIA